VLRTLAGEVLGQAHARSRLELSEQSGGDEWPPRVPPLLRRLLASHASDAVGADSTGGGGDAEEPERVAAGAGSGSADAGVMSSTLGQCIEGVCREQQPWLDAAAVAARALVLWEMLQVSVKSSA
jgi:hypothetical protein